MERPKKAIDRNSADFGWYQRILVAAKVRGVSETDIGAISEDLRGHRKCANVTSRLAARKICVGMPINIDGRVRFLI